MNGNGMIGQKIHTSSSWGNRALTDFLNNMYDPAKPWNQNGYGETDAFYHRKKNATEKQPPQQVKLITLEAIEAQEFDDNPLIDGLLDERESLVLPGPSGVGKSLALVQIGLSGANPPAQGLWGLFDICERFKTVIIQAENTKKATNKRLRGLFDANPEMRTAAANVFMPEIKGDVRLAGELTNKDFQKMLIENCQSVDARLLILDPLISYHEAEENDNTAMRKTLDCLTYVMDTANVACIVAHHVAKAKTSSTVFSGRGASAIGDWASNVLVFEKVEGAPNTIRVVHEKSRNFATQAPFFLERKNFRFYHVDGILRNRESVKRAIETLNRLGGEVGSKAKFAKAMIDEHNISRTTANRAIDAGHEAGCFKLFSGTGTATGYKFNKAFKSDFLDEVIQAAKKHLKAKGARGVHF